MEPGGDAFRPLVQRSCCFSKVSLILEEAFAAAATLNTYGFPVGVQLASRLVPDVTHFMSCYVDNVRGDTGSRGRVRDRVETKPNSRLLCGLWSLTTKSGFVGDISAYLWSTDSARGRCDLGGKGRCRSLSTQAGMRGDIGMWVLDPMTLTGRRRGQFRVDPGNAQPTPSFRHSLRVYGFKE